MTASRNPAWWDAMAAEVELDETIVRFDAAWYAAMRDLYLERYPDADERSKDNIRSMADWAAARSH